MSKEYGNSGAVVAQIGGSSGAVTGAVVGKTQDDRSRATEYRYYQNQQYQGGGYRP